MTNTISKSAVELRPGDEWREGRGRDRVRMTGSRLHAIPTIIWIDAVDLGTGEPRSFALYRENRRLVME